MAADAVILTASHEPDDRRIDRTALAAMRPGPTRERRPEAR
jgi:hypothetical protein